MTDIKRLPDTLKRGGVNYFMISRTEKVVLWELKIDNERVAYEISQIYFYPE